MISALILAPLSLLIVLFLPDDLSSTGKITLAVWLLAIIAWTLTPLNDTFIALAAAISLMLSATIRSENFFASLGNSAVWLMIGAAIVGSALNQSGLPGHLTLAVTRLARTVAHLFYLLTAILLLTALTIPSISIRTTLMVPIYLVMATAFRDERIKRALALMLPINLTLTSVASLVGDGAHLVINDALGQLTGQPLSFLDWLLMGLPFAAVSAFGTTWVILRMFLDESQRRLPLDATTLISLPVSNSLSWPERYTLIVTMALLLLWLTEPWHGLDNALVALLGALAVTIPAVGAIKFDESAAELSWNAIAFVGATLFLSNALVESGAGGWLVNQLLVQSGVLEFGSRLAMLTGLTLVTLCSHLLIPSRTTRGAVIAPAIVLLAYSTGFDPQTLAFITAAGIGYSITLFVSARTLLAFQRLKGDQAQTLFTAADLVRLSGVLAPFHIGLIVLFGLFYWPVVGPAPGVSSARAAQERLHNAPITTGRPGLLQDQVLVPVEVLDRAGVRRVNGEFQVNPPPVTTLITSPGLITSSLTATPPPVLTPLLTTTLPPPTATLTLTVTPALTATPLLTPTALLTGTPTLTTTPPLTTTPVLTTTPLLTMTPPLTTTPALTLTPPLTTTPTLISTPVLTTTATPGATPTATLELPTEAPTTEPVDPAVEPSAPTSEPTAPTVEPPAEPDTPPPTSEGESEGEIEGEVE